MVSRGTRGSVIRGGDLNGECGGEVVRGDRFGGEGGGSVITLTSRATVNERFRIWSAPEVLKSLLVKVQCRQLCAIKQEKLALTLPKE